MQHMSSSLVRRSPLLSPGERQRSSSPYESLVRQRRERIAHDDRFSPELKPRELRGQQDSQGTNKKNKASRSSEKSCGKVVHFWELLIDRDRQHYLRTHFKKRGKRRKKEEKRLRKEEKRRRREKRRRKREERHQEKLKVKGQGDNSNLDGEHATRRKFHSSDNAEAKSEQKQLEIELREKALESLKAKKGISR
ncbi:hypothetical protein PTKIN_Ptkin11bG0033200 [Pterospermum kingtungense]